MRKIVTLITGASGEVGLALVKSLADRGNKNLLTLDIKSLPDEYDKIEINHIS